MLHDSPKLPVKKRRVRGWGREQQLLDMDWKILMENWHLKVTVNRKELVGFRTERDAKTTEH